MAAPKQTRTETSLQKKGEQSAAQRVESIKSFFSDPNRINQLAKVLPNVGVSAEKMVQCLFSALNQTPRLQECTPTSLFKCLVQAATLGLEINTPLGQASLVPFKGTCQLIIEYKGFITLANRTGERLKFYASPVYRGDDFSFEYGIDEGLHHKPAMGADRGKDNILYFYAYAKDKHGMFWFHVMTRAEVDAIRKRSPASSSGPWVTDYVAMGNKTAVRQLIKYIPVSMEDKMQKLLTTAAQIDSENEVMEQNMAPYTGVIDAEYTDQTPPETAPPAGKAAATKLDQAMKKDAAAKNQIQPPAAPKQEEQAGPFEEPEPPAKSGLVPCPNHNGAMVDVAICGNCEFKEIDGVMCPAWE